MSFLHRLFSKQKKNESKPLKICFGRFLEPKKSVEQYDFWDRSLMSYESQNYLDSIDFFFKYLSNDSSTLFYERKGDTGNFSFYQGSKRIFGHFDKTEFRANVLIATTEDYDIAVLRRLLNHNRIFQYCRYCLNDDNDIVMFFDSSLIELSPYHLFYGLKELAVYSDNADDLLLDEFKNLKCLDGGHIGRYPDDVIETKIKFLRSWYDDLKDSIAELNNRSLDLSSAISYSILGFVYQVDMLLSPKGHLQSQLEKCYTLYYSDKSNVSEKNDKIIELLDKVLSRKDAELASELYHTKYIFSALTKVQKSEIDSYIQKEISSLNWYREQKLEKVLIAISKNIIGFISYNYSVHPLVRSLCILFYKMIESEFFISLSLDGYSFRESENEINRIISVLIDEHKRDIIEHNEEISILDYSSESNFYVSYVQFLSSLKLRES